MQISRFIVSRIRSFSFAFQGFKPVFKADYNIYIHSVAAIVVIAAGFIFNIQAWEWVAIIFAIGFVFVSEFLNSAIEKLADIVMPQQHLGIKVIKDIAAAAVLISAITAVFVACVIFIPKI